MTAKFKVTPLQQGRFIAIDGPILTTTSGQPFTLTRSEAEDLHRALTQGLQAAQRDTRARYEADR